MPAIAKTAYSPEFVKLQTSATERNEHRDCTVKAVALVCGVSYEIAHAALAAQGRQNRHGCYRPQQQRAIEALGFKVRKWSFQEYYDMLRSYPTEYVYTHITTHHMRRWRKNWEGCHPNMLLFTRGHVAALKNGEVIDWSINKSLRVQEIWEVEKM